MALAGNCAAVSVLLTEYLRCGFGRLDSVYLLFYISFWGNIMLELAGFSLIGIVAGFASGLLGIGGAVIIIPALILIFGFTQSTAQGTTLMLMVPPIGLLAAIEYVRAGFVNWKAAIFIAAFFLIGGWIGAKLAVKMDPVVLRKCFALFLMFIAVRMFFSK